MSPELIAPHQFGLEKSRPTKFSDRYAFGMVVYEVLSGKLPFHTHSDLAVALKVEKGERPPREAGFTERLWMTLETCWAPHPSARPRITDILRCLESDDDGRHSSDGTATLEGDIGTSSGESHSADNGLGSASSISRPLVVEAVSGTDSDSSVSEVDSNDGSACQVRVIQSCRFLPFHIVHSTGHAHSIGSGWGGQKTWPGYVPIFRSHCWICMFPFDS